MVYNFVVVNVDGKTNKGSLNINDNGNIDENAEEIHEYFESGVSDAEEDVSGMYEYAVGHSGSIFIDMPKNEIHSEAIKDFVEELNCADDEKQPDSDLEEDWVNPPEDDDLELYDD